MRRPPLPRLLASLGLAGAQNIDNVPTSPQIDTLHHSNGLGSKPPNDSESERPTRRSGSVRAGAPRSRLASRVERVLSTALAGEPRTTLNVKASELLAEAGPVAEVIGAAFDQASDLAGHLRVSGTFSSSGLDAELVNSLVSHDPDIRIAAAQLCAALRLTDAVPWLGDLMEDPNPRVRDAAIRALGRSGGHRAVDILMAAIDRFPQHRLAIELSRAATELDIEMLIRKPVTLKAAVVAVLACGLRKDRLRTNLLLGIAHDRRWPAEVRVAACRALGMIGDPATDVGIRGLMADPEPSVQEAAGKANRRVERASRAEGPS
jgi:HEAT repeats